MSLIFWVWHKTERLLRKPTLNWIINVIVLQDILVHLFIILKDKKGSGNENGEGNVVVLEFLINQSSIEYLNLSTCDATRDTIPDIFLSYVVCVNGFDFQFCRYHIKKWMKKKGKREILPFLWSCYECVFCQHRKSFHIKQNFILLIKDSYSYSFISLLVFLLIFPMFNLSKRTHFQSEIYLKTAVKLVLP